MEAALSPEKVVSCHITTWRHNSQVDLNLQLRENYKSRSLPRSQEPATDPYPEPEYPGHNVVSS
jgi:hypothetical protein